MNYINKILTIGLMAVTCNANSSESHLVIANSALNKLENIKREDWSFKLIETNDDDKTISVYDPRNDGTEQWQLISINDLAPTEDQIKTFIKNKNGGEEKEAEDEKKDKDSNVKSITLSDMIVEGTVVFIEEKQGVGVYHFQPLIEDMEEEAQKLTGELHINLQHQYITNMAIKNTDELNPAFSVSIDKFAMNFAFGNVEQRPVLTKMTMNLKGTIGFLKSIKQNTSQEFVNYQYVAVDK